MRKQNGMSIRARGQKMQIFKIQVGGRPQFWKSLNRHISVKNYLISMKFCRHYSKCWTRLQSRDQKLKVLKFKMAATAILKIAFFGRNSSTDCPISAKFCMRKQNGMSTRAIWKKLQIFKIQDGGRPSFLKSLNCHISVKNRPILMKFDTLHQILNPITVTWPKIFKIRHGDA